MKRFLFLFLFFTSFAFGQNLIPNPSVEDYIECPEHLGGWPEDGNGIDRYAPPWESYRGTPDYFNNCFDGLGSNNPLGYQEPRTGEGFLGAICYSTPLPNGREYIGVALLESLEIGQTYFVNFNFTLAYRPASGIRTACSNIGLLLMTENYLDDAELGVIINYSNLTYNGILTDTTNWVTVSTSFIADSAYSYIAFGNFYDDELTDFIYPFEPDNAGDTYYFFDDFCLSTSIDDCDEFLAIENEESNGYLNLWPNPAENHLSFSGNQNYSKIDIYNSIGETVYSKNINPSLKGTVLIDLPKGIYIASFTNKENRIIKKRFMVQ